MNRFAGIAVSALLALCAAPAIAQSSGEDFRVGGDVCVDETRYARESASAHADRIARLKKEPEWIRDGVLRAGLLPEAMTFTFAQQGDTRIIRAEGWIDVRATDRLDTAFDQFAPVHEIVFNSQGGSFVAGRAMGDLIRSRAVDSGQTGGLTTRVEAGEACIGACTSAFLGGVTRTVEMGGLFGAYLSRIVLDGRSYNPEDTREHAAQMAFLERMGISTSWIDLWFHTRPGCVLIFSRIEMNSSRVVNVD